MRHLIVFLVFMNLVACGKSESELMPVQELKREAYTPIQVTPEAEEKGSKN
jgi:hypothetical protein